jgi:hypothetical protein
MMISSSALTSSSVNIREMYSCRAFLRFGRGSFSSWAKTVARAGKYLNSHRAGSKNRLKILRDILWLFIAHFSPLAELISAPFHELRLAQKQIR